MITLVLLKFLSHCIKIEKVTANSLSKLYATIFLTEPT